MPTAVPDVRPVSGSAGEVLSMLRSWESAPEPGPIAIATSGSTGSPKRVLLSRSAMRASAHATENRLGGPGQWLLTLPPNYVAGVQVLFRSVRAGLDPVLVPDSAPPLDLATARDAMTGPRCYLSLVPTQLHRLLHDSRQRAALARFDAVLIGGGPLPGKDRTWAEECGVPVVATYGMSETCGGCVYDGAPLDGVEVRIDDGRVLLRGPVLFSGYQDDPDRTQAAFEDGWLITHDLGRVVDGRLEVLGRDDDVIITGGVKVPALAVAHELCRHPAVAQAHVLGLPDAEWGERVVAVVVTHGDATPPGLAELRDLVRPRTWAPRAVVETAALPVLGNGKPDREALAELARAAGTRP